MKLTVEQEIGDTACAFAQRARVRRSAKWERRGGLPRAGQVLECS
jgi:hypothetical protein